MSRRVCCLARNSKVTATTNKDGSASSVKDLEVYFGSEQFDMTTGWMLGLLVVGVGLANFVWTPTTLSFSTYPTTVFFVVLSFRSSMFA